MAEKKITSEQLKDTVVRICPACGVVNPAGPSEACPHLQLARFRGVDEEFVVLLEEVAEARSRFVKLADKVKSRVRVALRNREAEIETPRRPIGKGMDSLEPRSDIASFNLENPVAPPRPRAHETKRMRKRKTPEQPKIDPRQLELIAREPPKGDA